MLDDNVTLIRSELVIVLSLDVYKELTASFILILREPHNFRDVNAPPDVLLSDVA